MILIVINSKIKKGLRPLYGRREVHSKPVLYSKRQNHQKQTKTCSVLKEEKIVQKKKEIARRTCHAPGILTRYILVAAKFFLNNV